MNEKRLHTSGTQLITHDEQIYIILRYVTLCYVSGMTLVGSSAGFFTESRRAGVSWNEKDPPSGSMFLGSKRAVAPPRSTVTDTFGPLPTVAVNKSPSVVEVKGNRASTYFCNGEQK